MRSTISQLFVAVALWSSLSGCSIMPTGDVPAAWEGDEEPARHTGIEYHPDQIPGYAEVWSAVAPLAPFQQGRPLTAAECACLAGARSQTAAVLDKEASYLRREVAVHGRRGVSRLLPEIVADRAREERNDAAEQALIAYYQLVEVNLQNEVLDESYVELQQVEDTVTGLRQAGFVIDFDPSEVRRRRSQLDLQKTELLYNKSRLTVLVKTFVYDDPMSPDGIETKCAIEPRPPAYGFDEAIRIARLHDFELKSLQKMLHSGDVEDLDVARKLLGAASPFLGQAPGRLGMLAKLRMVWGRDERGEHELRMRQTQLRDLHAVRQQQLDLEVGNALATVEQRFLDLGIAKDVLDNWDRRVETLETNRELQKSEFLDVVNARAERLKAKSDLLHRLIQLEIEHVRLQGVLGLLWEECAAMQGPGGQMPGGSTGAPCRLTGAMQGP